MTDTLRHIGIVLIGLSVIGAFAAVRDARRQAQEYIRRQWARDHGGHVRVLTPLFDFEEER